MTGDTRMSELRLVSYEDKHAIFESDDDHTLFLLLLPVLEEDERVSEASFAIDHPQVGKPKLIIRIKKGKPEEIIRDALTTVEKQLEKMKKDLQKVLKEGA